MKTLLIHTKHFPPHGFHAITIFPVVFYNGQRLTEREVRHETIHLWQQAALLVLPFYLLYLLFWLYGLLRYHNSNRAYRKIPFERSAYHMESNPHPTVPSMAFGWIKT